jgi:hypothetical protein
MTDQELLDHFHHVQLQLGELYNKQKALKILLNSYYGATGFPGFRWYDLRMSTSVTLGGQVGIKIAANAVDEHLHTICPNTPSACIGGDTDSFYVNFGPYADKLGLHTVDEISDYIKDVLEPIIEEACKKYFDYMNHFEFCLNFKREVIAETGFFLDKKKRYAMLVKDSEGVRFNEPELKVVGLELLRSSTPAAVKPWLEEAILVILANDRLKLVSWLKDKRDIYETLPIEDISQNSSVSNITKYIREEYDKNGKVCGIKAIKPHVDVIGEDGRVEKTRGLGIPINSMAAINFNDYILRNKLDRQYDAIREGSKIKMLRLKPNPYGYEVIGYEGYWNQDFDLTEFIDRDTMFEKTFKQYIRNITNTFGWNLEIEYTVDDLF